MTDIEITRAKAIPTEYRLGRFKLCLSGNGTYRLILMAGDNNEVCWFGIEDKNDIATIVHLLNSALVDNSEVDDD
jgi:hypothetical protein